MENQPMASCKKCLHTEDELIAKSWLLVKHNWWHLLKLILLPIAVTVGYYAISLLLGWIGTQINNDIVSLIIGIVVGIMTLLYFLYYIWAMFAFMYGVFYLEEKLSLWKIYTRTLSKIFPLIWIYILFVALVIPGFMIFIIPGILLLVWFSMAFYVCLDEGTWGLSALWKSKELVKGFWWSIIGRFTTVQVLMVITIYTMMYILGLAGIILGLISSVLGGAGIIVMGIAAVIGYIIYFAIMMLLAIFAQVYFVQVYKSIKEVKGEVKVKENKTINVLIIIWLVVLVVIIPLVLIFFGLASFGGLFEALDSAGLDNILRELSLISLF